MRTIRGVTRRFKGKGKSTDLLSKTDTWASVERNKNERVMDEICLGTVIKEAIRVEFKSCSQEVIPVIQDLKIEYRTVWAP